MVSRCGWAIYGRLAINYFAVFCENIPNTTAHSSRFFLK
jgi:hypothetical protein